MVVNVASTAWADLRVHLLHYGLLSHVPIGWLQSVICIRPNFIEEGLAELRLSRFTRLSFMDLRRK